MLQFSVTNNFCYYDSNITGDTTMKTPLNYYIKVQYTQELC